MINNVVLVGRAGSDPEIRNFDSGRCLAELSIACKRPTKEDKTDWFRLKIWGKAAETASQYLKKGHLFGIEGRLQVETWDQDGESRSRVIVVANSLRLLQSKDEANAMRTAESDDVLFGSDEECPF